MSSIVRQLVGTFGMLRQLSIYWISYCSDVHLHKYYQTASKLFLCILLFFVDHCMLHQFGHDNLEVMLRKILRFEMRTLNTRISSLPDLRDFASKIEIKMCHRIYHDPLIFECVMEIRHFTLDVVSHPFIVFWDWIWIRQHHQLPLCLFLGEPNRVYQYMPGKLCGPSFKPRNDHFGVPFLNKILSPSLKRKKP